MARIAVAGFHHETNSFVAETTDFAYFASHRDRPPLVKGEDVLTWLGDTSFALSGFLKGYAWRPRPRAAAVDQRWRRRHRDGGRLRAHCRRARGAAQSAAMPVDAVYLDLHGAMVSEPFEDGEGELLRRVRAAVGPKVPIGISLDYHSNVTPLMVEASDSLIGYRTYPHVDRFETGQFAARALSVLLRRGRPAGRALRKLPFLIPLNDQCTLVEPSKSVVARSVVAEGELVNLSYLAGFPPSDLYWCGPAVIAHAWSQRAADAPPMRSRARSRLPNRSSPFPCCRPRTACAKPCGSHRAPTNRWCSATPRTIRVAAPRPTPPACSRPWPGSAPRVPWSATSATPRRPRPRIAPAKGQEITLGLGGRSGPAGVTPFQATFRVARLGSGKMRTTGQVSGGREIDLGPMALLQVGGIGIAVTSKRMQALDQAPFRHLGLEPSQQKILSLKSTCHFRAEFEPIAAKVIVVIAPGGYLADPAHYPYRRLRPGVRLRPLGPHFEGMTAQGA